ncbi:MAG: mismatch repair protein MutL [Bacillales bacterium]|nr:mismatch repair protein MutL [Bacillales bacterium]
MRRLGKIIQLSDDLANKIAAGEVVERPASVVKELVENSIDAGSKNIEIYLEEAGLRLIRVIDDGEGMSKEDAILSIQRHATSKIATVHDLFRIRSLGFRGEALPSIASISEFKLTTCDGINPGFTFEISGGVLKNQSTSHFRKGTEINVSNLFFNTPARLKYVKTIQTELGTIIDYLNKTALTNPNISFKVYHNDKKLFFTLGNDSLEQVLVSLYGLDTAKKAIKISNSNHDFSIEGYIVKPEISRASRNYITISVNKRIIKNISIQRAIIDGYDTLLMTGRYPIAFLNINVDPYLVDVNVHPTKMEVRLSKEESLIELIKSSIKRHLLSTDLIPEVIHKPKVETMKIQEKFDLTSYNNQNNYSKEIIYGDINKEAFIASNIEENVLEVKDNIEAHQDNIHRQMLPELYIVGQIHGTYIVAQNDEGMFLIDQHAAQERVIFELFSRKVKENNFDLQQLLIPYTFDVSQSEKIILDEYSYLLEQVGIMIEQFGDKSYIIRSHPTWFPKGIEQKIIDDIINQLVISKTVNIKTITEETIIMMSCKAAIKANRFLRSDELESLIESLRETQSPYTCPHGRPIIIKFTVSEIEKMFKRII